MDLLKEIYGEVIDNSRIPGKWFEKEYLTLSTNSDLHFLIRLSDKKQFYGEFRFQPHEWTFAEKISEGKPFFISELTNTTTGEDYYFYYFKKKFYMAEIAMTENDVLLVINESKQRKKEKLTRELERIKAKTEFEENLRVPIPEEVQITVWNRDGGKCVKCGSSQNLEFDHIIPVSKGGSNTARNIQLLCEHCNRSKGADIGG